MGIFDFLKKKEPRPREPTQPVVANISPETNGWNRQALESAAKELCPTQLPKDPAYWQRRQEETYEWNKQALALAQEDRDQQQVSTRYS